MSKVGRAAHEGARKNVKSVTASVTLAQGDSGKTILLNSTSALTVTLPELSTLQTGTFYRFVVQTANNNAYTITTGDITDSSGDMFVGGLLYAEGGAAAADPTSHFIGVVEPAGDDSSIVLDANAANGGGSVGSWFEIVKITNSLWMCDGRVITDDANGTGAGIFVNS